MNRDPSYCQALELLGSLYTEEGRLDEGLQMDQRLVKLQPLSPNAFYNLSCSFSLKNQKKEALHSLAKAISLGYNDSDWMRIDDDLRNLHQEPLFWDLVYKIEQKR